MKPANHKSVTSIMSIVANRFAANKDVSFVRSGSSNQLYLWKCWNKFNTKNLYSNSTLYDVPRMQQSAEAIA